MKKSKIEIPMEFKPSPKLKIIFRIYGLIFILIGIFTWLIPMLCINFYFQEIGAPYSLYYFFVPMIFLIMPLFLLMAYAYLKMMHQKRQVTLPFLMFIAIPSLIICLYNLLSSLFIPIYIPYYSYSAPSVPQMLVPYMIALIQVLACYLIYVKYISRFCDSIKYELKDSELVEKMGVWNKKTSHVPYKWVMNVDIKQGPFLRRLNLGALEIFTPKFSSVSTIGPSINIEGIENFEEIREILMKKINSYD